MKRKGIRFFWLVLMVAMITATITWRTVQVRAATKPATYTEPVVLSSQDGVLEVTLTARQGEGKLDTVELPVKNMLLFGYKVAKGTASNGRLADQNLYPAPTLNVQPGDTLIVHLENQLVGLDIADFFDPAYTPVGQEVAVTPAPLANAPFNIHTHGLHVSPMGNSDNVLLTLEAGAKNTYSFKLPKDHAQGMYWYHGHLHTLTTAQTYSGLAGLLIVGRADGNLPAVTKANLPIRSMAIQYNMVADRQGGQHQLNNPNWGQFVSTQRKPAPGELESGKYEPSLAPVNFANSAAGTHFVTNWYAGPLSIDNHRGQFELIPNNLVDFQAESGTDIPANPSLPDSERDVQFTVNGQFQPKIASRPGQTEIWVLANISDLAYVRVRLTETATGRHPNFAIVGQDGLPYSKVQTSNLGDPTVLTISPASRFAIAVTIPQEGELLLEMPPADNLQEPYEGAGVAYTSRGLGKPASGRLGTVKVDPKYISYFDGFFIFPTQVLLRASAASGAESGTTVAFAPGQELGAQWSFFDTQETKPDVRREVIINGGFLDDKASMQEPKAFIYAFDGRAFPNTALLRARLNSIEEWSFVNYNNDEHPIHIHVNDFQVTELIDPVAKTHVVNQPWGQDNVNVPAPLMAPGEKVLEPGKLTLRTHFEDFLGSYVMHCHRLNHEDNGLMAMVNVIPEVSGYAVAHSGTVEVRDGKDDAVLAKVVPFPGFSGPLSLAMSDVDGDAILDLVVGTGPGTPAQVLAYSGAGKTPFTKELARFSPFGEDFSGGVSVAGGSLDGNAGCENIVVGSGPGMESRVVVFSSQLPLLGQAPKIVGNFKPYPGQKSGVTLAVGMVDSTSGLNSIITAPGPGGPTIIRAFRYELENAEFCSPTSGPAKVAEFRAFDATYTGGVSLAVDWTAGEEGGAQMIVLGQLASPGQVRAYSSGSALDGFPSMYTTSPTHHDGKLAFRSVAQFTPFEGADGVRVATTSTTSGANLLVSGNLEGETQVQKYQLLRADAKAKALSAKLLAKLPTTAGPGSRTLGGD